MAGKIFVNYRRDDARDSAARLRDKLAATLGEDAVFMDVDNLLAGERFDLKLKEALADTEVFLAVIGPRWLSLLEARMASGERDFVREEIGEALAAGIAVIPVLMDRAPMPKAASLPEDIRELTLYHKHDIAYESFGRDVAALIEAIETHRHRLARARMAAEAARLAAEKEREAREAARLACEQEAAQAARLAGEKRQAEAEAQRRTKALENAGNGDAKGSRWRYFAGLVAAVAVLAGINQAYHWLRPPAPVSFFRAELPRARPPVPKPASQAPPASPRPMAQQTVVVVPKTGLAIPPEPACDGLLVSVASGKKPCIKPGSGAFFKDCPDCPEMVVVPAGSFTMGSPSSEPGRWSDEGPQHKVRIAKPFAVGRFAVTFAEWDACVADGGCGGYKPKDRGWGRGSRPVIYVSWNDAKAYVKWLSDKTHKEYRLLSEAEWEYVTRAGTKTPFWWGDTITTDQANYNGNYPYNGGAKGEYRGKTLPVRSFKPNPWGLYQVHGNVWEWVEDCWNDNYKGAPADGFPWLTGNCASRALRGGSWNSYARSMRAASRRARGREGRYNITGFRCARVR